MRQEATLIWSISSLTQYGVTVLVAGIAVIGCWYNISGKNDFTHQVTAINVALIATVIVNAGGISLLLAGRRAVGLRRHALLGDPGTFVAKQAAVVVPRQARAEVALVGGPGLAHFHRADCAMAVGRGWPVASATVHAREQRTPCGVCQP